jgi:hypothetical protein
MTRSKKIFVAFAIVFALFLAYVAYDIGSRTTFPGAQKHEPHPPTAPDTLSSDTLR